MLIATITALFFLLAGGDDDPAWMQRWIAAAHSAAPDYISDADRLERVVAVLDEMREEVDGFRARIREVRRGLVRVDARYESTRVDFDEVFERLDREWARSLERLIDLRFELHDQVRRSEWAAFIGAANAAADLPPPTGG